MHLLTSSLDSECVSLGPLFRLVSLHLDSLELGYPNTIPIITSAKLQQQNP